MLRTLILCADEETAFALERAVLDTRLAGAIRIGGCPAPAELAEIVRQQEADAVFLSVEPDQRFAASAAAIEEAVPGLPVVAVGTNADPARLLAVMRAGAREFLAAPFEPESVRDALFRLARVCERREPASKAPNRVFVFLPSKPGAGTSTVALHTSLAVSRLSDKGVLLADFDLNAGIIGFMLRIKGLYSAVDAVDNALSLDDELWTRLVSTSGRLDLLPSGRLNPGHRIDPALLKPLLRFWRRTYNVICVDLSGMMEKFSLELMQEAGRIFLVCTPEIPSLHLAAQKLEYLATLDLSGRVQIILNREGRQSVLPRDQIERIVGAPIHMTIPNDYASVHDALMAGKSVSVESRLGKRFEELAQTLLDLHPAGPVKKRRLLDYFAFGSGPACEAGAK